MATQDADKLTDIPVFLTRHQPNIEAQHLLLTDTLKRHPKMELDKTDLLQLLSYLEGELQARDVVIAALKLEKMKAMLAQAKYGRSSTDDPISALQRDSDMVHDNSFDEASVRTMYGEQLAQLERLIATQHTCQQQMRDQLIAVEKQYHKTCAELEETRRSHSQEMDEIDKVMCLMAKDRDRLKQEVEQERAKNKRLEGKLKTAPGSEREDGDDNSVVSKHRQVALMLIRERSRLVLKLLETRNHSAELERLLCEERDRVRSLDENLERQIAECEQLCSRLSTAESLNRSLQTELDKAKSAVAAATAAAAAAMSSPRQNIIDISSSLLTPSLQIPPQHPHTAWINAAPAAAAGIQDPRRIATAAAAGRRPSPEANVSVSLEDVSRRRSPAASDRDVAAATARLRSVLSTAMDGSSTVDTSVGSRLASNMAAPASNDRQTSPRQPQTPTPVPSSKLPVLLNSGIPPEPFFISRSGADSSGGIHVANPTSANAGETRTMRRLVPLATASVGGTTSPRLAPLATLMAAQANGVVPTSIVGTAGYSGQKMPSLMLGKPK